jgi:hypothetical protein
MASRYALSCSCGQQISVGPAQAGDRVTCLCGKQLDVPTLRAMQELPPAETDGGDDEPLWGIRQGLVALGIIVAILTAIPGAYWWWMAPDAPTFRPDAQMAAMEQQYEMVTPLQAWLHWNNDIVPLAETGLWEEPSYGAIAAERSRERLRNYQKISFGIAGVAVLFSITVALWKNRA